MSAESQHKEGQEPQKSEGNFAKLGRAAVLAGAVAAGAVVGKKEKCVKSKFKSSQDLCRGLFRKILRHGRSSLLMGHTAHLIVSRDNFGPTGGNILRIPVSGGKVSHRIKV